MTKTQPNIQAIEADGSEFRSEIRAGQTDLLTQLEQQETSAAPTAVITTFYPTPF